MFEYMECMHKRTHIMYTAYADILPNADTGAYAHVRTCTCMSYIHTDILHNAHNYMCAYECMYVHVYMGVPASVDRSSCSGKT